MTDTPRKPLEWTRVKLDALIDGLWPGGEDAAYTATEVKNMHGAQYLRDAILREQENVLDPPECHLPHRKNAMGRLITGRWENADGVNFCYRCGQLLEGSKSEC